MCMYIYIYIYIYIYFQADQNLVTSSVHLNSLSIEAENGPEIQGSKVISPERVMDNLIMARKIFPANSGYTNSEVDQELAISCESVTSVELVFGSLLWLR